jgi:hypothetical protein
LAGLFCFESYVRLHFQLAAPAGHRGGLIMLGVPQTGGFDGRGTFLFTAGARAVAGNLLTMDFLFTLISFR